MKLNLHQLTTAWPRVPLGDLVDFLDSQRKPIKASERVAGPYPYYGANGIQGHVEGYLFDEKLVLLAEDGGYFFDEERPITYVVDGKCWVNNHAHVLRARAHVVPEFLNYQLGFADVKNYLSGSTRAKLTKGDASRIEIICPPISEQDRIVDLLSRAEGIVRLRREAEKKAAELIPAIFLDMFGDPAANPTGWPVKPLGEIVEEFRYGTSQKSGPEGLPVLRIPNVVGDRLEPADMTFVAVPDAEANRLRLADGDMLFVRTNGNPDYVGRSAVFDSAVMQRAGFDGSNSLYASYLIRARIQRQIVDPSFLQAFLSSGEGRRRLKEQSRTSAGQFNINTEGLASIQVPLPDMALQSKFVGRCKEISGLRSQQATATAKAKATFDALLAQVFNQTAP